MQKKIRTEGEEISTDHQEEKRDIPIEIVRDILLTLPSKSLLRFKSVCKPWRALISDPHFVKSRLILSTKSQALNLQRYGVIRLHEDLPRHHSLDNDAFSSIMDDDDDDSPSLYDECFWQPHLSFISIDGEVSDSEDLPLHGRHHSLDDNAFFSIVDDDDDSPSLSDPHISFSSIDGEVSESEEIQLGFLSEKESVNTVEILGSCNGLLLISTNFNTFVWNPSIRKYKELHPAKDFYLLMDGYPKISGLGYDSKLDKYKAVIAFHVTDPYGSPGRRGYKSEAVHVYLIKGGSSGWERGQWLDHNDDFDYCIYSGSFGVTLNGAPHWVVGSSRKGYYSNSRSVIYFDVAEENFKRVPQPKSLENTKFDLAVLGEYLCIVHNCEGSHVDIWAMKDHGVEESWMKLFVIGESVKQLKPLGFTTNGDHEVVMVINKEKLVTYNFKAVGPSFTPIMFTENNSGFQVAAYVESLVSP